MMRITFLGTGTSSGVPMIGCHCAVCRSADSRDKRYRSSVLVETGGTTIVIDAGPDFRSQMLAHGVEKLDAVLVTHAHKDHIAGLDDVRAFNYFQKKSIAVYGSEATLQRLRQEYDYAFAAKKYPGIPEIQLMPVAENNFMVGDISVTAIPVWHHLMPVLGFRLGGFTYITDANRIEPASLDKIKGSAILTLNALRKEAHLSHFTLQQAIDVADEAQAGAAYFTHISHQMGLHSEVEQLLPDGKFLAYDGLQIEL